MIVVWEKPTKEQLASDVKNCIEQAKKFFKDNPKRKVCKIGWFACTVRVRRDHVAEDVEAHAKTIETK